MITVTKRNCFFVLCYCLFTSRVEGHEKVNSIGAAVGNHASTQVQDLFQDYFEWKWRIVPESASTKGLFELLHGDELNDMSLHRIKSIPIQCQEFQDRAQKLLDSFKMNPRTEHFLNVLKFETKACTTGFQQEGYLLPPISFMNGIHIKLTKFFKSKNMKLQSLKDYQNVIKRLKRIPTQIDEVLILLKLGVDSSKTHANESIFRTKEQLQRLQVRSSHVPGALS